MSEQEGLPDQQGFNDPLKHLLDFHGTLRRTLKSLQTLALLPAGSVSAADITPILDLLRGPVIFHDIDEESLLIPLLLERLGPDLDVDPGLARCQRDHEHLEELIEAMLPHLLAIAGGAPSEPAVLDQAARNLSALMLPHLELEEQLVFPIARRLFTEADLKFMAEALAVREQARTRSAASEQVRARSAASKAVPSQLRHQQGLGNNSV